MDILPILSWGCWDVVALTWAPVLLVVMARLNVLQVPPQPVNAGLLNNHHTQSNLLAFSTRPLSVSGGGVTVMSFWWSAVGIAFLKAYIMVSLLAPDLLVLVDHSWYHLLNGLFPILEVYMSFVASNAEYDGIKCFCEIGLERCPGSKTWCRLG